ncbi:MAG: glutamate carboxypeptidase [Burkholderiaceae bacterium]
MKKFLTAALAALALLGVSLAQARDNTLMQAATAEQPAVVKTLERLVNIETGTGNAEGLAAMADLLEAELKALGATVTRHKAAGNVVGDNLVARIAGTGQRRILLIAHMDTVYVKGTLAKAPFRVDGARAFGPGIADDKSGIAVILHTLTLLKARGFTDFASIGVLFNTDEERGSTGSAALIEATAREHDVILSFEPTLALREMMTRATSGIATVRATVQGRAAHSGTNPELGVNAMVEASDFILRTLDLDQPAKALRFNWTVGSGGQVPNIIPDRSVIEANVRYLNPETLKELMATLQERAAKPRLKDAQIKVELIMGRPAFNADAEGRRLIDKAVAIYKEAGAELTVIPVIGGGTDAAYAALSGKPVLEGLGLPGFGYHSDQAEYVMIDAIPRRLYLAARMIMDIAQGK